LQSKLFISKSDGREGKHLWELTRFPASLYDEFLSFLLLFLQTAGSAQRAESLEKMTSQQATELLDWGVVKLDVSIYIFLG
jgi:hypothetical protein